ncbi:hypothetical protein DdX_16959 [Ditylenchus destructor]|uniref:Uncharacterized protein n=1 Tax=Ditylenchus destructor TaxID=166010 RepID=A0AAD4QTQ3_9BILA|nr:hypothetical protein DdX_16959 [Ditylenchus destructor]
MKRHPTEIESEEEHEYADEKTSRSSLAWKGLHCWQGRESLKNSAPDQMLCEGKRRGMEKQGESEEFQTLFGHFFEEPTQGDYYGSPSEDVYD